MEATAERRVELAKADEQRGHYGVVYTSARVWKVKGSYGPGRVEVWSNTDRPNPHPGERRWNDFGSIGGDGKYLDPRNKGTDEEFTVLLSPESTIIDAYGTGTGTAASGQVWADDRTPIASGEVLVLVYPDGREERWEITLKDNYGHGEGVRCPDPQ